MGQNPSVTIKNFPPKVWKRIKLAAVQSDENLSEFALKLLQEALQARNGKAK